MIRLIALGALLTQLTAAHVIQGTVRSAMGQTIEGAIVTLGTVIAKTDSSGSYHLRAPHDGAYSLRFQAKGYITRTSYALVLAGSESKQFDVTLEPLETAYFDQPNFVVAGVTGATEHGGHGSDTILRSTETLAKQTASLDAVGDNHNALDAVRAYQHAAEIDPSEPHYFDWGSELLIHRAINQAIEVFTKAARLFPSSSRVLLGLAVAWYTNGSDDNASHYFFAACDLRPADPMPYRFLGEVQSAGITRSDGYVERLTRFVELRPNDPEANYYYAASLWKQRKPDDSENLAKVEKLLNKAIQLDVHCSAAYLQLGILYSAEKQSASAIEAYRKAGTEEAHYRLSQEYRKLGENEKADEELKIYNEQSRKSADEARQERLDIQQFVFKLREPK